MPLLNKLKNLGPSDLPTPPSIALKIVHACSNPNMTGSQIAEIVGSDTALLAELLRMVNSPFFGIRQKVSSAQRAVVVLGVRSLRNLALCFTARESLRPQAIPELDANAYWAEVLRRAVSARILAETVQVDPDEAFAIGILQDIGLLAMFLICPDQGKEWPRLQDNNPDDRQLLEMEIFGATHDALGKVLAENWELPEQLIAPIANHHSENMDNLAPEQKKMSQIALCADWMAAVYTASDKRLALAKCKKLIADHFDMDHEAIDKLLEKVPSEVIAAAKALGLEITEQFEYEQVVSSANKQLIEQPESYEDKTQRLERALEAREHLVSELQNAYNHLALLAYYDPLTTLVNRRRFEEVFAAEIGRHCRSGGILSIVLIDIDHFKNINDKHGHALGDTVLQSIATILKGSLRGSDMAVRLGGDEMCMLLPETDVQGGEAAVQRIQKQFESLKTNQEGNEIKVTASFGGCSWHIKIPKDKLQETMKSIDAQRIMESIMETADKAMYKSKENGRNAINWATLSKEVAKK